MASRSPARPRATACRPRKKKRAAHCGPRARTARQWSAFAFFLVLVLVLVLAIVVIRIVRFGGELRAEYGHAIGIDDLDQLAAPDERWFAEAFVDNFEDKSVLSTVSTGTLIIGPPAPSFKGTFMAPRTYGVVLGARW
ncbi:MAG: hypothetical protein U1A22_13650 [Xanthomonadaceae bacterium]|nr:hypothetical protein [Xanthomonadaceae bacterium]